MSSMAKKTSCSRGSVLIPMRRACSPTPSSAFGTSTYADKVRFAALGICPVSSAMSALDVPLLAQA
jgi:hypothetical protein